MKLAELQERFWRLITAPEPVSTALPELAASDPGVAPLRRWIDADSEASAVVRLDVYAGMYFFRLLDVLREDYPGLVKLVGDDAFHNLVVDYLLAHPSDNPSLRWLGRHLPGHLDDHPLRGRFPAAAALARLEWMRGEAFDVEDAPVATAAELAVATPSAWSAMRLRMHPSLRLLDLDHNVLPLWLALERGAEALPEAPAQGIHAVVWRRGFRVYHRSATRAEIDCLRAAAGGVTFAALCETLWAHAGDDTPARAVGYLRTWLEQEIVASIALPP
ncbi:MAG TPA: DNA-binding domain-containing protein [Kofleriaceae bacterium]|nr:DNA-binding domain-containing protein [Kofleriaceae bacterium]